MQYRRRIDLDVPADTAFAHWCDLGRFPQFTVGVDRVDWDSASDTHWIVSLGSLQREFDATVLSTSGNRVVWDTKPSGYHRGQVRFDPLGEPGCRMTLHMALFPQDPLERLAEYLGLVGRRLSTITRDFKHHVEHHAQRERMVGGGEATELARRGREAPTP